MSALCFSVDRKHFKNGAFRKQWHHYNHVISLTEFSSNTAYYAWKTFDAYFLGVKFSNLSAIVWTGLSGWSVETARRRTQVQILYFSNSDMVLKNWSTSHSKYKGPGKRGHIVADTNVSPFARTRNICCGHKVCVRDTKNVTDFVQKHFVPATNVSQFAQPKKHHGQQCVLVYQGLKIKTIFLTRSYRADLQMNREIFQLQYLWRLKWHTQ